LPAGLDICRQRGRDRRSRHDDESHSSDVEARDGKEVTLIKGETFFESPEDVHVVGRNASQTEPAKFLAFFVKDKGAPVVFPAK
jgi:hypothetical protein